MQKLKSYLQTTLRGIGLYHRVKASALYHIYWSIADSSLIEAGRREAAFYHNLLVGFQQGDLLFDFGANHCSKTGTFLKLGARVVAVEPDESNQEILKEKFLRYRLFRKPVVIVSKAV